MPGLLSIRMSGLGTINILRAPYVTCRVSRPHLFLRRKEAVLHGLPPLVGKDVLLSHPVLALAVVQKVHVIQAGDTGLFHCRVQD